jgi:Flp pilus assembly protein TadG
MKRQRGVTTVEFAIVGSVLMAILFGAVEFGRLLWTYAVLSESARRATRLAAVCPVDDPKIRAAAMYDDSSLVPPGLTADKVEIAYLAADGQAVENPAAHAGAIHWVRVSILPFRYEFVVPGYVPTLTTRQFSATLPRESLGWHDANTAGGC